MRPVPGRILTLLAFALGIARLSGGFALAGEAPGGPDDLSGRWVLVEGLSRDPAEKVVNAERAATGGARAMRGERGGGDESPGLDLPLEALVDVRRLVVADAGTVVRVTYPSGRKRAFFTDGEERELDDGDGPAKVVARRSGPPGEKITITSRWPTKRSLKETWSLLAGPRRLLVEGKVEGRESFRYQRTYEPAPPETPVAAPKSAGTAPSPAPHRPAGTPAAPTTPPSVSRTDCTIRPPKGTRSEELRRLATISEAEAERRAVASVAPLQVASVISSDPEVDEGCLVVPFVLHLEGRRGVQEVLIDAGDGKVISSRFESAEVSPAPNP